MPSSLFVRTRNGGKSFELRITHRALKKPVYRTFNSRPQAERAGLHALEQLKQDIIPNWLQKTDPRPLKSLAQAVHRYLEETSASSSTEQLLGTIVGDIGSVPLSSVDFAWAENWILQMKLQRRLAPGTIRKRKGALEAVFNWLQDKHPLCLGTNPLARLPHGYSAYNRRVKAKLAESGVDVRFDVERNRRIDPDEEVRIVRHLQERVRHAETPEERAQAEGLSFMFQLALRTAMRMREIYTLTMDQIRLSERTIFLNRTKNGDRRQVPLGSEARAVLELPWPSLEATRQDNRLLPFWNGSLEPKLLAQTTSRISKAFARVFEELKLKDVHFHDTRHEALCRWVLHAPMPLTSEELGRAAGMRDARTRQRYLSLRGSELAAKLG